MTTGLKTKNIIQNYRHYIILSAPTEMPSFYPCVRSPSLSHKYPLSLSPNWNITWASAQIGASRIAVPIDLKYTLFASHLERPFYFSVTCFTQEHTAIILCIKFRDDISEASCWECKNEVKKNSNTYSQIDRNSVNWEAKIIRREGLPCENTGSESSLNSHGCMSPPTWRRA